MQSLVTLSVVGMQAEVRIACDRVTRESGALQKLEGQLTTMQYVLPSFLEEGRASCKLHQTLPAAHLKSP